MLSGVPLSNMHCSQWKRHLEERRTTIKELKALAKKYADQLKSEQAEVEQCLKRRDEASSRVKNLPYAIPMAKQVEEQRHIIESKHDPQLVKTRAMLLQELRTLFSSDATVPDQEVVEQASSLATQLKTLPTRIQELSDELSSFDENFLNPQQRRAEEARNAGEEARKLEPEIILDGKRMSLLEVIRASTQHQNLPITER